MGVVAVHAATSVAATARNETGRAIIAASGTSSPTKETHQSNAKKPLQV
jgi:hypothetical protein